MYNFKLKTSKILKNILKIINFIVGPIKLIFYIFHLIRAIQIDSVLIFNDLTATCCFFSPNFTLYFLTNNFLFLYFWLFSK